MPSGLISSDQQGVCNPETPDILSKLCRYINMGDNLVDFGITDEASLLEALKERNRNGESFVSEKISGSLLMMMTVFVCYFESYQLGGRGSPLQQHRSNQEPSNRFYVRDTIRKRIMDFSGRETFEPCNVLLSRKLR